MPTKSRKKFQCIDCKIDTGKIGEHYMLIDSTWFQAHCSKTGMLCIGCLEQRLGRQLIAGDFNQSHVNIQLPTKIFSLRLLNRLNRT